MATTENHRTKQDASTEPAAPALQLGHGAVLRAVEQNTVTIGDLRLPSADTLVWCGGLVTMAAFGVIEWPVAVAIGVGHLLAQNNHVRLLRDFGQALEEA